MVSGACLEDDVWCMSGGGWWRLMVSGACLVVSDVCLVVSDSVWCMSGGV